MDVERRERRNLMDSGRSGTNTYKTGARPLSRDSWQNSDIVGIFTYYGESVLSYSHWEPIVYFQLHSCIWSEKIPPSVLSTVTQLLAAFSKWLHFISRSHHITDCYAKAPSCFKIKAYLLSLLYWKIPWLSPLFPPFTYYLQKEVIY